MPVRFDDFRIVVTHSSRPNDDVRMSDVLGTVTFEDLNTHLLQAIRDSGSFEIRSRNTEPEIDEHLGDAGHADAADAYEMNVLNSPKHKPQKAQKRTKAK